MRAVICKLNPQPILTRSTNNKGFVFCLVQRIPKSLEVVRRIVPSPKRLTLPQDDGWLFACGTYWMPTNNVFNAKTKNMGKSVTLLVASPARVYRVLRYTLDKGQKHKLQKTPPWRGSVWSVYFLCQESMRILSDFVVIKHSTNQSLARLKSGRDWSVDLGVNWAKVPPRINVVSKYLK